MPRKSVPILKTLKGTALLRYADERRSAISKAQLRDPDTVSRALVVLQTVAGSGSWDLDHLEFPSLPGKPTFGLRADQSARSFIPIPAALREHYGGKLQTDKRWSGRGIAAWTHYLADVDILVRRYELAPENQDDPEPEPEPADRLATVHDKPGEAVVMDVVKTLFATEDIVGSIASIAARKRLKSHVDVFLGFLQQEARAYMSQIDNATLVRFRNRCLEAVRSGKKAIKTCNDYLAATRRILKWCEIFANADIPRAYEHHLRDISAKEVNGVGSRHNTKRIGINETVAMPLHAIHSFMIQAMEDPFEYALMMCSWNLASGAEDLSALQLMDYSTANPTVSVDLDRKLFITRRGKTGVPRWVEQTRQGELAIRMMDRTHESLKAWLKHRESLIKELAGQRNLRNRMEIAQQVHRLRAEGLSWDEIARQANIPRGSVAEYLKQPDNTAEYVRSLAKKLYPLDAIVAMTGLAKSTIYKHVRDILAQQGEKTRTSRWAVVKPDENRVFFVPATGRPLVNEQGTSNYVENVFDRICDRAGIYRESDLRHRDGTLKDGAPKVPAEAFILPRGNGHYIIRRSAATIAGMLAGVNERTLQTFMGHTDPHTTRKYVKYPPSDYKGERMTHDYKLNLHETNDPVKALEEFFKHVFKGVKKRD